MQVLPGDFLEIAMQCGFYTIFWSETFRSLLKLALCAFCARNNRASEEEEDGYEAIKHLHLKIVRCHKRVGSFQIHFKSLLRLTNIQEAIHKSW